MFWKTKQQQCFVLYRGTKFHHSFGVPRKNEPNESQNVKIKNLGNITPNAPVGKSGNGKPYC
jgi:hypothetical protein